MQRRQLVRLVPGLAALATTARGQPRGQPTLAPAGARRAVPSQPSWRWPVIGLGTWLTFDVAADDVAGLAQRAEVLRRFVAAGGGMIDSSPMYGRSEAVVGELRRELAPTDRLVYATKVWTPFDALGPGQFDRSRELWKRHMLDVCLVHNLLNRRSHLPMLRERQERGELRLVGVSTSHGRDHDQVAALLRAEPLDVLQLSYSLADRRAEDLLELAAERKVAVVVNRPFDGGALFGRVAGQTVPAWAREVGCSAWSQLFLKWIVAHPAVSCTIPATRQPAHLDQNMAAASGPLPDAAQRRRIASLIG